MGMEVGDRCSNFFPLAESLATRLVTFESTRPPPAPIVSSLPVSLFLLFHLPPCCTPFTLSKMHSRLSCRDVAKISNRWSYIHLATSRTMSLLI